MLPKQIEKSNHQWTSVLKRVKPMIESLLRDLQLELGMRNLWIMEEDTIENAMFPNAWVRKFTKSLKICFNNPRNSTVSAGFELNLKPLLWI